MSDQNRRHLPCEVLIVDDHEQSRSAQRLVLEDRGFAVIEARSGFDALVMAQISRPRIILMDIALPEIDGLQLTRMLRADPVLRHCAIIAITAFTSQDVRDSALAAGCDAFMTKPFSSVHLLDVVRLYARCRSNALMQHGIAGPSAAGRARAAAWSGDAVASP